MIFLSTADVITIHESVIEDNELQGQAKNKSIGAIISRIDNRIAYGMIRDVYELAACYACYIAVGHAFHDANKRTAFAAMDLCLALNGIDLDYVETVIGALIVKAAQGVVDEVELADWLMRTDLVNTEN
jgi:death-on-curing protein